MSTIRGGSILFEWSTKLCGASCKLEKAGLWFVRPISEDDCYESRELITIPNERTLLQEEAAVVPDPLCVIWACRHARSTRTVLFLVHTHVTGRASFSQMDEDAERRMAPEVIRLTSMAEFGSAVVTPDDYAARIWRLRCGEPEMSPVAIEP